MKNTHTVVGLFENKSEAQKAVDELVSAGFDRSNIDISNRRFDNTTATASAATATTENTGIGGFFRSLFGEDEVVTRNYTNAAYDADAIVTVHADSDENARRAAEILDRYEAFDVDSHAEAYQRNYADTDTARADVKGEKTIPVIEENLAVGKRTVEKGGVRVRSRIIEKPVEETLRLREEHVIVERRPVDRAVSSADLDNFKEGEYELTERAEKAVVNKEARVVEEVAVGKNVEVHDETIRDTVRRTDVDVEKINSNVDVDVDKNVKTKKA